MRIYTSSWFTSIKPPTKRIGISRGVPRGQPAGYKLYRALAPGPWFKTASITLYYKLFMEQLDTLDARIVVADLEKLSDGNDCVLLCFESPVKDAEWCHRGHVSLWLHRELGIQVTEYGDVAERFGAHHPKLPHQYRAPQVEAIDINPWIGATFAGEGETWTIVGRHTEHVDQAWAEITNAEGAVIGGSPVTQQSLEARFRKVSR